MFDSMLIRRFRGIERLQLDDLSRVNLLLGKNNAGKTTILESMFLLCGATSPSLPNRLANLRGLRTGNVHPDNVWRSMFLRMDPDNGIEIAGHRVDELRYRRLQIQAVMESSAEFASGSVGTASSDDDLSIESLRLTYTDAHDREFVTKAKYDNERRWVDAMSLKRPDYVMSTFLSARSYSSMDRDANQFSHLVKIKQDQEVVEALSIIEPRVCGIEVLSEYGGASVYVDLGLPSLIPLAACGEGFVRFFSIIVEITSCRRGLLLVDEIDNGLHHSVMDKLWVLLGQMSLGHDVQIVATTHNDELVMSAVEAFGASLQDLSVHRIDLTSEGHVAVHYDEDTLPAVRAAHFEIRG